jgi:hypothetical protein
MIIGGGRGGTCSWFQPKIRVEIVTIVEESGNQHCTRNEPNKINCENMNYLTTNLM